MTFPSGINFTIQGYSWSFQPEYEFRLYASGNTRQRKRVDKNNDIFNVRHVIRDADVLTMENYINVTLDKGSLTDTMPYYVSEVQYTGTGQVVDGRYDLSMINNDLWSMNYQIEIVDRSMTEEETIYNTVNSLSGFENAKSVLDALEDMVNNNNL